MDRDAKAPTLGHLRALDGIRALAVTAVVLYHAGVPGVVGGFLGVDVFFVLSGFLITSLLLAEMGERGSLSFTRFYERRARRLFPALVLLIGLVTVYAYAVVPHGTYASLPAQVLGTMAYVGNWTLLANHAAYFTIGLPASPLQHTWSLAIEEQFYLLWPLLLIGIWRISKRRPVITAICLAGATVCAAITAIQFEAGTSVDSLYFATQTHATTLLIGAALAVVLLRRDGATGKATFLVAPESARRTVDAAGVVAWVLAVATFFVVTGTTPSLYRGGYLAFGLVLAVAIGATVLLPGGIAGRVLSLPPLVALGRISYGVYLFHFPLFLWIDHGRTHLSGPALFVVRIAATLAVATASYVLVEQPVRQRRVLAGWRGLAVAVPGFVAAAVVAFVVTSAAASVPFADRVAKWNPQAHAPAGTSTTVLLVGDSMAQTLGDGIDSPLASAHHLYFAVYGDEDCSLVGGEMRIKDFLVSTPRRCQERGSRGWEARWAHDLRALHPAASMMLFRLDVVDHKVAGRWTHVGEPDFDCVLRHRLVVAAGTLAATGRPVILLTTPFYDSGEQPSGAGWPEDAPARVQAYNAILRAIAAEFPGVVHVIDLGTIVSPHGSFTRTIGSTEVRWVDGVHFTYAGDAYVLPRILRTVLAIAHGAPTPGAVAALEGAAAIDAHASCPS